MTEISLDIVLLSFPGSDPVPGLGVLGWKLGGPSTEETDLLGSAGDLVDSRGRLLQAGSDGPGLLNVGGSSSSPRLFSFRLFLSGVSSKVAPSL